MKILKTLPASRCGGLIAERGCHVLRSQVLRLAAAQSWGCAGRPPLARSVPAVGLGLVLPFLSVIDRPDITALSPRAVGAAAPLIASAARGQPPAEDVLWEPVAGLAVASGSFAAVLSRNGMELGSYALKHRALCQCPSWEPMRVSAPGEATSAVSPRRVRGPGVLSQGRETLTKLLQCNFL